MKNDLELAHEQLRNIPFHIEYQQRLYCFQTNGLMREDIEKALMDLHEENRKKIDDYHRKAKLYKESVGYEKSWNSEMNYRLENPEPKKPFFYFWGMKKSYDDAIKDRDNEISRLEREHEKVHDGWHKFISDNEVKVESPIERLKSLGCSEIKTEVEFSFRTSCGEPELTIFPRELH